MKRFIVSLLAALSLITLTGCKSSDYEKATQLMLETKYEEAATVYATLGDYKDAKERATMLSVKQIMDDYVEVYNNFGTLSMVNYDAEIAPLQNVIEEFEQLDKDEISKYPELKKYVDDVAVCNQGFLELIDLDHESIREFLGPKFYMFPSTMALNIQQSETLYRSWLQRIISLEFPYQDVLEGTSK